MNISRAFLAACYALCLSAIAFTSQAGQSFTLAPSLLRFDYTEFNDFGRVLDSETGWIPGFELQYRFAANQQTDIELDTSLHGGSVDYNGQTQTGIPHTTTTDTTLFRLGARLLTPLRDHSELFLGARYHVWGRDINDNNGVSGLYEEYQWWELNVGISALLWEKDSASWSYEAAILRTVAPTMHADLGRINLGEADLDLGTEWGTRLALSWQQQQVAGWSYGARLMTEYWEFGRSDIVNTAGGASSISIFEPSSETWHTSVQLLISRKF